MRTTVRTGQGTIVHEGCATSYDHESGDLWIVDEQGGVDTEYRAGDYLFVTIEVVDPDEPDTVPPPAETQEAALAAASATPQVGGNDA